MRHELCAQKASFQAISVVDFLLTFGPLSLLLFIVWLQDFIPVSELTEDITALAGVPLYTGALSQIGIVLWAVTAGICFFSAHMTSEDHRQKDLRLFLLLGGCLTVFLMLDDLFRVHERLLPVLFSIPETVSQGAYVAITFCAHACVQTSHSPKRHALSGACDAFLFAVPCRRVSPADSTACRSHGNDRWLF
jgi:hypothetical protein